MSGGIPPFPQYALMAWCSVKAQEQLYLYLYWPENENSEVTTDIGVGHFLISIPH
jgi:hypothetical protein